MTQQPPSDRPPARVAVTSPWTQRPRLRPARTPLAEIEEQSEVGRIYVGTLLRAQLRLAASTLLLLGLSVGLLPLVFLAFPVLNTVRVLGMPVSWGILAFGCYPVLVLLAWRYVRLAERNERAFARMVERS